MRGVEQAYWARQGRLPSRCRRSTTTRRCRAAARRQVDTFRAAPRHLRDSTLTNHQGDLAAAPSLVPFEPEADVDDEFTVFDGFGRDNKPVRSDGQKPASSGAGLSWDEERQVWEKANRSMFGRPMANLSERISGASVSEGCHPLQPALLRDLSRASGASPWDLRTMSSFKSPDSLNRFRSQAPPQPPSQPHSPLEPPPPPAAGRRPLQQECVLEPVHLADDDAVQAADGRDALRLLRYALLCLEHHHPIPVVALWLSAPRSVAIYAPPQSGACNGPLSVAR